jgi:hypothetical protein
MECLTVEELLLELPSFSSYMYRVIAEVKNASLITDILRLGESRPAVFREVHVE